MGNKAATQQRSSTSSATSNSKARPASGGGGARTRKSVPAQQRSRRKIMDEAKPAAEPRAPERPAAKKQAKEDDSPPAKKPTALQMALASRGEAGDDVPSNGAPAAHPFAAALKKQQTEHQATGVPALRPVFNPGDFAKATLRTTDSRVTERSDSFADDPAMDSVRAKQIEDARRCSKEASEVYPWLRVSGDWVARNADVLRDAGVTHILNMAHTVCANYHEKSGDFQYLALDVIDSAQESIICFLLEAIDFIERARAAKGVCFVHCHMGVSRSCTVAIAYAMWRDKLSFDRAAAKVKAVRPVCSPNAGFVGQLMEFERQLTQTPRRPQLYRVARHSPKDGTMIVKLCHDRADRTRPVTARPAELDARGVFLVHDFAARAVFVWVGPRCAAEEEALAAADKYAQWLLRFMPAFEGCELLHAQESAALRRAFWRTLGVSGSDAEEMDDADVDQDLLKYDDEFGEANNEAAAAAGERDSRQSRQTHLSGNTAPDELARAAEHFRVHLFAWTEGEALTDRWDRLKQYDADDLSPDGMFVLLVHDRDEARRRGENEGADATTSTSKLFHRAFVWLGAALEGRLNEEAAVDKAKSFVRTRQRNTGSEDVDIQIVRDDDEPEHFWSAFEAGY